MSDGENDLAKDLHIDLGDLTDEMIRQPSLVSYYINRVSEASLKLKNYRLTVEVFESALDRQIRDKALMKKEKLTETEIKSRMKSNDTWINHQRKINELESGVDQLKGIVEALKHKKDMLIQVGSNEREERRSTGMKIKSIPVVEPGASS